MREISGAQEKPAAFPMMGSQCVPQKEMITLQGFSPLLTAAQEGLKELLD